MGHSNKWFKCDDSQINECALDEHTNVPAFLNEDEVTFCVYQSPLGEEEGAQIRSKCLEIAARPPLQFKPLPSKKNVNAEARQVEEATNGVAVRHKNLIKRMGKYRFPLLTAPNSSSFKIHFLTRPNQGEGWP